MHIAFVTYHTKGFYYSLFNSFRKRVSFPFAIENFIYRFLSHSLSLSMFTFFSLSYFGMFVPPKQLQSLCCTHNKYQFSVESTLFLTQYYFLCTEYTYSTQRPTIPIYGAKICFACIFKQINVIYINVSVSLFGMFCYFLLLSLVWFSCV